MTLRQQAHELLCLYLLAVESVKGERYYELQKDILWDMKVGYGLCIAWDVLNKKHFENCPFVRPNNGRSIYWWPKPYEATTKAEILKRLQYRIQYLNQFV